MKKMGINLLTLLVMAIITPFVLVVWIVIKGFASQTKHIKVHDRDFWQITNRWDDFLTNLKEDL